MTKSNQELLREIELDILNNMTCPLKDAATNLVFGKGNPDAKIMICAEAPGRNEDLQGKPFVGAAGKLLDKLLIEIGLSLDDVYVANILKYRPPNNRDPSLEEIRRHTPYLVRQIEAINPKVICTLGNFSTKFVLANLDPDGMGAIPGISKLRGKITNVEGKPYKVIPLYHPAAALYRRQLLDILKKDFQTVKAFVEGSLEKEGRK